MTDHIHHTVSLGTTTSGDYYLNCFSCSYNAWIPYTWRLVPKPPILLDQP